jgi:hypothetical protein
MRLTSTGLGIGTTSPSKNLDVFGSTTSVLRIQGGAGGSDANRRATLELFASGSKLYKITASAADASLQILDDDFGERARIDSSGNVGIGTSSPSFTAHVSGAKNTSQLFVAAPAISAANDFAQIGFGLSSSAFGAIRLGFDNPAGVTNTYLSFFNDNGSGLQERLRIDSSGRLGIGTASPGVKVDIVSDNNTTLASVLRVNSNNVAVNTSLAYDGLIGSGQLTVQAGTSSALIFGSNAAERARIDSSGRLLVGTSTSAGNAKLQVIGDSAANTNPGRVRVGTAYAASVFSGPTELGKVEFGPVDDVVAASISSWYDVTGSGSVSDFPGRLVFSTTADGASSPTERMRIGANGYIKASNSGLYAVTNIAGGTEAYHQIISNAANINLLTSATNSGGTAHASSVTSTAASGDLYRGYVESSGAIVYRVFSNGNVQNTNNSYGALSDIKLKENIVDANSQWNDLKSLQVRNYNFKEGQTHTQIGLIAQEVELVSPGLVSESPDRDEDGNDLGTVTKSVNYSVLYMKAVKALQEAMERIEQLETEMASVKAQLS